MQTVTKRAFDQATGQEYEVELPSVQEVKNALLQLRYPSEGLRVVDIEEMFAEQFSLSTEQKNAKNRHNQRVFYLQVLGQIGAFIRYGPLTKLKNGLIGRADETRESIEESRDISDERANIATNLDDSRIQSDVDKDSPNPEDSIEGIYRRVREELAAKLLNQIGESTPRFFEELVIDLLVKMGYGGSRDDAARAVGGSGDEGIDGIINEDRLGLDVVYVQAKRWQTNVSRPELQKFAGALQGQRAKKGIFITTSDFSRDAREYVNNIDSKIVLIDGRQLAEFMIDHDVGVSTVKTYEIKRVDSDYFLETDDSQTQNS